jgi:hypothetical protein
MLGRRPALKSNYFQFVSDNLEQNPWDLSGQDCKVIEHYQSKLCPPIPPHKFNVVENAETTFGKIAGPCNIKLLEVGA